MLKEILISWDNDPSYTTNFIEELDDSDHDFVMGKIDELMDDGEKFGEFSIEIETENYGFDDNFGPQMEFPEKTLLIMAECRGSYFLHIVAYPYDPEYARQIAAKKINDFYVDAKFVDYQILNHPLADLQSEESENWLMSMSYEANVSKNNI